MRSAILLAVYGVLTAAPAHAAGLPQLDAQTYSSQVIWLVVTFITLYVLMSRVALPRIGEVLEERQNRIEENLAKAEDLKAKAEDAAREYEDSMAKARSQAFEAIRSVKEDAAREAARQQGVLGAELADRIKEAEAGITETKAKALAGIREVAGDVAISAIEKLTGERIGESRVSAAVDAAIKTRG